MVYCIQIQMQILPHKHVAAVKEGCIISLLQKKEAASMRMIAEWFPEFAEKFEEIVMRCTRRRAA